MCCHRCPLLRRLVFVSWNRINKVVMRKAIMGWKDLESMTMPTIEYPNYIFQEISRSCKKFRELKVMGRLNMQFASSLTINLPNLRVLSIRCSGLVKEALILILDSLQYLEVLNISHSCFVEPVPDSEEGYRFISDIETDIISKKASKLREFHTCMKESCIMCHRTRVDCGLPRWFRYEEGIWKHDEVSSFVL